MNKKANLYQQSVELAEWVHNVECPNCGKKPTFTMTSDTTYQSHTCSHKQVKDLIEYRQSHIGLREQEA